MQVNNINQDNAKKFFDLTTYASGYPNFAREIKVKGKNEDYTRVNFTARYGLAGDLSYVNYDLKIPSKGSILADFEKVKAAINDRDKKVVMACCIGDAQPETFTYQKGEREGEVGVAMKGRMLNIIWCAVEGELVIDNRKNQEAA